MSDTTRPTGPERLSPAPPLYAPIKRRSFFLYAGATAGATALVLAGCDDDSDTTPNSGLVNVGISSANDFGVLNYAYALEQLEAAFYTQLKDGDYYKSLAASSAEKQILDDLHYHEVAHRDFFRAALSSNAIKNLEPDFATIDFGVRTGATGGKLGVLDAAKAFEDLGVAAYNGAGRYIQSPLNLVLAGKIVSVEARHASLIRDLLAEATFVGDDVVQVTTGGPIVAGGPVSATPTGLERSKSPTEVVAIANTFLKAGSKLDVSGLV
ncbi:ferritin-like domain-containing protein [Hymenobacter sp. BT683]|uniref:Ferritin-like domain-containing protein n=1 Tax=Hymenobacter jeongseonensis TaxID=2791027 RepID=A0ABS0IL88_9BACT|nr:ferritin-like domain-containing protein [Hymenobacter jeongseonensis]MBF9239133.1 ferritin-like domain-containing protein [Hymenobacter jeongseonensis]